MANDLNIHLKDKIVVVKQSTDPLGLFYCRDGFGLDPSKGGRAIFGYWLSDGTDDRIEGYFCDSLVEGHEHVEQIINDKMSKLEKEMEALLKAKNFYQTHKLHMELRVPIKKASK